MALGTQNLPYHHNYNDNSQKQYRQRPIAPAPIYSNSQAPYQKPQSTTTYNGTTLDSNNPSVVRRNARERNRVKQVNNGFLNLRQHIPQAIVADLSNGRRGVGPGANKKLSKVDTLKMAVEYIRRLQRVIDDVDSGDDATSCNSYGSNSCSSSMISASPSPGPSSSSDALPTTENLYQSQYMPLNYSGSFTQDQYTYQGQHQQTTMVSPAGSTTSSACSLDSLYHQPTPAIQYQMKFEDSFDEYQQQHQLNHGHQQQKFSDSSSVVEDEELLDYISLWQEDV